MLDKRAELALGDDEYEHDGHGEYDDDTADDLTSRRPHRDQASLTRKSTECKRIRIFLHSAAVGAPSQS